jgi:N-acetylmuramoyl-L-alanine amidase
MRIVVDPGHGGVDGGCNRTGFFEKDLNLAVGKLLHSDLIQKGASAQITRTIDEAMIPWGTPGGSRHQRDLAARIQVARDFQANAFISLHANAGPAHLGGALTFYRKGDAESKRLAALIQEQLSKLVPGNQNGILPAKFMVLTKLDMPAVLIEMGFITNPSDQAFLTSPTAPSALAQEIAAGVEAFARVKYPLHRPFHPSLYLLETILIGHLMHHIPVVV